MISLFVDCMGAFYWYIAFCAGVALLVSTPCSLHPAGGGFEASLPENVFSDNLLNIVYYY